MRTLAKHKQVSTEARAVRVRFARNMLYVALDDGREIGLSFKKIKWLNWLARATPKQRSAWTIDSHGDAIYWDELDDGIEVCHLLTPRSLGAS